MWGETLRDSVTYTSSWTYYLSESSSHKIFDIFKFLGIANEGFFYESSIQFNCNYIINAENTSEYDQEIPQSHTADKPNASWEKAT